MDIIQQLQMRYRLNKELKRKSFSQLFDTDDIGFLQDFAKFKNTRIGLIWLKKSFGQSYLKWEQS
jgi:hypothetical protein